MIADLWAYFAGFGFLAALFFNLRGIIILACALIAAAFAGLALSGLVDERLPWIFGIALMASPIIGRLQCRELFWDGWQDGSFGKSQASQISLATTSTNNSMNPNLLRR